MSKAAFSVGIFPFLKTSRAIRLGGFDFRSTTDTSGLSPGQIAAVTELTSMLYLRDNIRIASAAYTISEPLGAIRPGLIIEQLERVRTVVGYLYSSPHPTFGDPFLPFENASMVIVEAGDVSLHLVRPEHGTILPTEAPPTSGQFPRVPGYEGVFNYSQSMWLTSDSRIYGPSPNMILNISQDMALQFGDRTTFQRSGTSLLLDMLEAQITPFSDRVLLALNWYNEANKKGYDQSRLLLNLAVAFETLLQLPGSEKTDRFVDAISLLLGRTERLSDWAAQFYSLRSQVAHEGRIRDWHFYTQGNPKKGGKSQSFGSVMTYGRQIFQLCLETILAGAELAKRAGLKERFISNGERYTKISFIISTTGGTPDEKIKEVEGLIDGLDRFRFIGGVGLTIDIVITAVSACAKILLQCELVYADSLANALQDMACQKPRDKFENISALLRLDAAFDDKEFLRINDSARIVAKLAEIAWDNLALTYFDMAEKRKAHKDVSED